MSLDNRDYMRENQSGPDVFANITPLKVILAANIAVFVLQHVFGIWMAERIDIVSGRTYYVPGGAFSLAALQQGEIWTVLTHLFVHVNFMHLAGNMMMVFFTGRVLESILGPKNFLFLYFFSGLSAAGAQLFYQHLILGASANSSMIGASGSAFGLLLAFATIMPHQVFMLIFPIPMRVTAKNLGRAAIVISVVMLVVDRIWNLTPIAHMAHLGGAFAGLGYARYLGFGRSVPGYSGAPEPERNRRRKRKETPPPRSPVVDAKVMASNDFVSAEIDPILDKINREGMGSLTDKEKEILRKGQRKISKRVDGV